MSTSVPGKSEQVLEKTIDEVYEERNVYFMLAMVLAEQCGASIGMRERTFQWPVLTIEFPGMQEWAIHVSEDKIPETLYSLPQSGPYRPCDNERETKLASIRSYIDMRCNLR